MDSHSVRVSLNQPAPTISGVVQAAYSRFRTFVEKGAMTASSAKLTPTPNCRSMLGAVGQVFESQSQPMPEPVIRRLRGDRPMSPAAATQQR